MKKTFRHEGNSFILDVQTRAGEYKISLLDMETEEAKSLRSAHQFRFLDGERFELHTPDRIIEGSYHFTETDFFLHLDGKNLHFQPISSDAALSDSDLTYTSPMPGKLIHLPVSAGDSVEEGQTLFVVEAMKMENQVKARRAGIVESVNGKEGDLVNPEDIIITLES